MYLGVPCPAVLQGFREKSILHNDSSGSLIRKAYSSAILRYQASSIPANISNLSWLMTQQICGKKSKGHRMNSTYARNMSGTNKSMEKIWLSNGSTKTECFTC